LPLELGRAYNPLLSQGAYQEKTLGPGNRWQTMQYQWQYDSAMERHQWTFRRNCILTPGQLATWFLSLSALSLTIALLFAWRGAWLVLPFALVEVTVLALAFFLHARHAGDYERIVSEPGRLRVEAHLGQQLRVAEYSPSWVRVEYSGARRSQIRLVAGRQRVEVGRFVPDHRKPVLARELREALSAGV
jgi:uncharacterized membrane protein